MYITTFYSFKGGVGRSMALVNAGFELARRKRRVLLVDFDLEAPGLDTFKVLTSNGPSGGVVEFVQSYVSTGSADDIDKYVSKCQSENSVEGEIWLMPAGGKPSDYANIFQNIDWGDLYTNQDGYLLMEDLKQQWMDKIRPDYVLIDSRTGHTDVGGICTRQFPDAVAIFYFPNEQNLRGVSRVVREIRSEGDGPRKKNIQLHFIMSNVPDLDDEHQILEREMEAFKTELELNKDPMVVHRYDSLSLLNQAIFTQSRPRSRLAREYRAIVDQIVNENLGDRDGAIRFLVEIDKKIRHEPWEQDTASHDARRQLEELERRHSEDKEILYRLGSLYHREQKLERATTLYQRSIDLGYDHPEVYLDRARALADLKHPDEAHREAFRALDFQGLSPRSISRALKFIKDDGYGSFVTSKAVVSLDIEERIRLVTLIYFESDANRDLVLQLVQPIVSVQSTSISDTWLRNEFGLLYISLGKFELAGKWLSECAEEEDDIANSFNLAIANWGVDGKPSRPAFKTVVELHESESADDDLVAGANYLQCIALAYWATEDSAKGLEFATKAELALEKYERTFSCWRYLYADNHEFLQDIQEMKKFINGDRQASPTVFNVADEIKLDF